MRVKNIYQKTIPNSLANFSTSSEKPFEFNAENLFGMVIFCSETKRLHLAEFNRV